MKLKGFVFFDPICKALSWDAKRKQYIWVKKSSFWAKSHFRVIKKVLGRKSKTGIFGGKWPFLGGEEGF